VHRPSQRLKSAVTLTTKQQCECWRSGPANWSSCGAVPLTASKQAICRLLKAETQRSRSACNPTTAQSRPSIADTRPILCTQPTQHQPNTTNHQPHKHPAPSGAARPTCPRGRSSLPSRSEQPLARNMPIARYPSRFARIVCMWWWCSEREREIVCMWWCSEREREISCGGGVQRDLSSSRTSTPADPTGVVARSGDFASTPGPSTTLHTRVQPTSGSVPLIKFARVSA
jgi:hypothetical protein